MPGWNSDVRYSDHPLSDDPARLSQALDKRQPAFARRTTTLLRSNAEIIDMRSWDWYEAAQAHTYWLRAKDDRKRLRMQD